MPLESTLLLLSAWRNFGNKFSNKTWKILLSLPCLSEVQVRELNKFKLKHDFIVKNYESFRFIKLKESSNKLDNVMSLIPKKGTSEQYFDRALFVLWLKAIDALYALFNEFNHIENFNRSGDYQLFDPAKKTISSKIIAWTAKKIFLPAQEKMIPTLSSHFNQDEPISEEAEQYLSKLRKMISLEKKSQNPSLMHKLEFGERELKKLEDANDSTIRLKQDVSSILFLNEQCKGFFIERSKEVITQEQIELIEKNQRELIEEEEKFIASLEKSKKTLFTKLSDNEAEDLEIEETLESSLDTQSDSVANAPDLFSYSFPEIDLFLKAPSQINGVLSKSINGILKQLKMQLAKIPISHELKTLRTEKINEVYAHLVLVTAAFEQMIQAIQDQRWDHVVLGFRGIFIHGHFAVEQILSLKILLEKSKIADTHNLTQLAKEAEIDESEERSKFLEDVAMHLWFCYPGYYRFFSVQSSCPQPFTLLEKLFYPYKDKSRQELDTELLKEAAQLCFTRYKQTIEFVAEIASISPDLSKNLKKFLEKINEIQKIIQKQKKKLKNHFEKQTSILKKCSQALDIVNMINALENVQHFDVKLPLSTIKEYLQLMKISLEIPQKSKVHSLQKFLQVETLANMDKLFQHLFRTIILLQTGEDNHSHNLSLLVQLVEKFYKDGNTPLTEDDKNHLKEINLSITHHYLYKKHNILLKEKYNCIFDLAHNLMLTENQFIKKHKGRAVSYANLETKIEEMFKKLTISLELLIKLLQPVGSELDQLNNISQRTCCL